MTKNPFDTPPPPVAVAATHEHAVDQRTGEVYQLNGQPLKRNDLLAMWASSDKAAKAAKEEEMRFRTMLYGVFGTPTMREGTERVDIGWGWALKIEHKQNYSLKSKHPDTISHADAVAEALQKIGDMDDKIPGARLLAARLVKWSPELYVGEYKKLAEGFPELAAIINDVTEISAATPAISMIEPKEPK